MLLRALLSGNVVLFEEALAELSGIPIDRATAYIHDKNISGFRALYRQAGLPDTAYPAFREALAAMRAGFLVGEQGGAARLKRRMVERVLGACIHERGEDAAVLLALLRRFAVEAAREEARLFCDDLVADDPESIQLPNSQDSSASAFSARATGSSCGSPVVFVDTAPRSLFSGVITS